jgi:putative endopeptidase
MRSFILALSLFSSLIGTGAYSAANAATPSSEIPARREFPTNPEIDPCTNFYEHVCSKVNASFALREDRSSHTFSFSDSRERLLDINKKYFEKLSQKKPESKREQALKDYYVACLNPRAGNKDELVEISRLKQVFAKIKTRDQLLTWLQSSYLSTDSTLLSWGATSNLDSPVKSDLYVTTGLMSLPERTYYKKEDVMADFKSLSTLFFKTLKFENPEKHSESVIKIESYLAEVFPLPDQFRQIVNNRVFVTREELAKKYPQLKLDELLKAIPANALIRDWVPESLARMTEILATYDIEQIKDALLYHALYDRIDDSSSEFFNAKFEFDRKHFGGPPKRPDRQERCTRKVGRIFAKELDSILLPTLFPNFPREKFIALAEKVRGSLTRSLQSNTWLSKEARTEALNKMTKARLFLVAPVTDKEWDFLPETTYDSKSPLKNSKTISKIFKNRELRDLREDSDPARWGMGPLTVNAYYDGSFNKFVMPIGILQFPFYDPNMPEDENLAAVGSVIGHELGHGVDDQGSRYDSIGKQRVWMSIDDLAGFSKRAEQLVGQFNKAGHNGKLTLGENIGDLVGLTSSFEAAAQDPEFEKSKERMQKFYTAYARVWCEVKRPKYIETQLKTDPHSLGVARVNEQMKQAPGFQKAFACKSDQAMTLPANQKVRIW